MISSKSQTPEGVVEKVTEWLGSASFYSAIARHTAICPSFTIEGLGTFERDPIFRTLHVAYGYVRMSGKLLPLKITVYTTDITIRIGLMRIVVPMEEVEDQ